MKNKKIICYDFNGYEEEIDIKKLVFRPSVYGILIKNNKILLVKKWDGYDFPGGGAKIDETVEETLKREFREETGIKVKSGKIVACETSFLMIRSLKKYVNAILIYFLCSKIGGELSSDNFSESEKKYLGKSKWIDLSEIDKIKFCNSVDSVKIIKQAIKLK